MPKNKLFSLFGDSVPTHDELVAGPSQNLDSISTVADTNESILRLIRDLDAVRPKVNYTDFSNFVFFNSAYDYFNITGEKILNEYPFDGTADLHMQFIESLDDYLRYVLSVWPSHTGHLSFKPSSGFAYVTFGDVGKDTNNITKTSILNMSTSSFSIEFWSNMPALTGSNDTMVIFQKATGSLASMTVYASGSNMFMSVASGSSTDVVSSSINPGATTYYCFTYNRSTSLPVLSAFTGSSTTFPSLVSYITGAITNTIDLGTSQFFIGSGSLSSKVVRPLTGSIDEVRLWRQARTIESLSGTFNTGLASEDDLLGMWSFNESGSYAASSVLDKSGRKLNGTITNFYSSIRESGSLLPLDLPDPILFLDAPEVQSYISIQQTSGTLFDKDNDNIITRMIPEDFFIMEELKGTTVLRDFIYVMGRYFDSIKTNIDLFVNVLRSDYTLYDQVPDVLLAEVAKFFGWEFTGNFLNSDTIKYIVGRDVLLHVNSNKEIDTKLYLIKNEFWKRVLINLIYMYKTKGTRESVETLMNAYGVNKNIVKLKEYGTKVDAGMQTSRIFSERSIASLGFGSGSYSAAINNTVNSKAFWTNGLSIESRVKFPTSVSTSITASFATGSIWSLNSASDGDTLLRKLYYTKASAQSLTGNLVYSSSEGTLSLSNIPIFDNTWVNIAIVRNVASSSLRLSARKISDGEISYSLTVSASIAIDNTLHSSILKVGSTASIPSLYWMQELRVWNDSLTSTELDAHTLDFLSYGTDDINGSVDRKMHWRFDENISADASGELYNQIHDHSMNQVSGSGTGFKASTLVYKKFLNEFSHIASPEYGWNEDKVRVVDSSFVTSTEAVQENNIVALEFNLIDALNEDISLIISSLDSFDEAVGAPLNRYRDSYVSLDAAREEYFRKLNGRLNFRVFSDMIEFFDRSFVDMVRKLIPARSTFVGDEFVVESHMLERPKLQWNYRRADPKFSPIGTIKIIGR